LEAKVKHLRILAVSTIGIAAAGGGIAAAAINSSSPHAAGAASSATRATVNVATATVNGTSEKILVDNHGLPLYTFAGDSPTTSAVSGQLAALWPPLVSATPTESGTSGKLTVVNDANGAQVRYDGRFLYTFVSDSPGRVTGEGIQNFFVATPAGSAGSTTAPTAPASRGGSYGYGYGY
jgi:predicted lipoprotein with Yx(FWY)xxD motif